MKTQATDIKLAQLSLQPFQGVCRYLLGIDFVKHLVAGIVVSDEGHVVEAGFHESIGERLVRLDSTDRVVRANQNQQRQVGPDAWFWRVEQLQGVADTKEFEWVGIKGERVIGKLLTNLGIAR